MNDEPIQTFDLPDHCEHDHVAIHSNDAPKEPPFEAIPYDHRDTFDDGTVWFCEPDDFEVTEAYREAVAERADVSIEDIKLDRHIPTYEVGQI